MLYQQFKLNGTVYILRSNKMSVKHRAIEVNNLSVKHKGGKVG